MSKREKLIQRLLNSPQDFTWNELTKLLSMFGYTEQKSGKTGGSRRKFMNDEGKIISLHKPHPGNIVKQYIIKDLIIHFSLKSQLNNE